jgi:hypothetical protein
MELAQDSKREPQRGVLAVADYYNACNLLLLAFLLHLFT